MAEQIRAAAGGGVPFVLDCIGSKDGSINLITKVVEKGARVAVLLPVIVRDASEDVVPVYEMDVKKTAEWPEGVEPRGVRTHFYLEVRIFVSFRG